MDADPTPPWRQDPPPPTPAAERAALPRRAFMVIILLAAVVGVIALVLSWAGPKPTAAIVPLHLADAADPFAAADLTTLLRTLPKNAAAEPTASSATAIDARLDAIRSVAAGQPVIVYVAGRATADATGVSFWPAAGGVPLRGVLERLKAQTGRRKLLVLDVQRLTPEVADGIPADLDAVPDADRLTLVSCVPGQQPLWADEFGRSAFTYYFADGLRGWAAPPGATAVTAHDLARFVQTRVKRWATDARGRRQTPTLYGDGPDFPLAPVRGGRPADPLPLADAREYPGVLRDGWATLDRLRAADVTDPARVRRLETVLLEADERWRAGANPAALPDEAVRLIAALGRPLPDGVDVRPASLAARADAPDAALADAVRTYFRTPATTKPEDVEKLAADVAGKLRAKPSPVAARAVIEAVADVPDPSPDVVRRAESLVQALDPRPRAVELAVLSRLADVARTAGPGEWDAATVSLAFRLARDGERATTPTHFSLTRPLLDAAARDRHEGEAYLFAAGFVTASAATPLLSKAGDSYQQAARVQAVAATADGQLARADGVLHGTVRYQAERVEFADRWLALAAATRTAGGLRRSLATSPADDRLRLAGELEEATRRLTGRLAAAGEPFRPEKLDALFAAKPDPSADELRQVEALLTTPLLPADKRATAWAAYRNLSRRLGERVRETDAADGQVAGSGPPAGSVAEADEDRRAERIRQSAAARAKDLLPPVEAVADADTATVRRRLADAAAFREWLAGWYEAAAADPTADGLFASAALDLRLAVRSSPRPPPRPTGPPGGTALTLSARSAVVPVRVELPTGERPDDIAVLPPAADWLTATTDTPTPALDRPALDVPLRIGLAGTAEATASLPPRGVLVRVRTGPRTTFLRVPVDLTAVRDRLELSFGPTPEVGTSDALTLRPGGPRTLYLHVRNPGDRPRALTVEVAGGGRVLAAPVKLPPGGASVVRFPAGKPGDPLDDLPGPLVVRLVDADRNGAVVARREFRPQVLSPATYVPLVAARVYPPGTAAAGKNRVEVVLRSTLAGPLPRAELVVAKSGPPPVGTLRGEVPAGDGALRLFADDIPAAADGRVRFAVTLDGVERAYRFEAAVPPDGAPAAVPPAAATRLELVADATAVSGPKLPVKLVVDHPPADATLELALGRLTLTGLEADAVRTFPSGRRTRVGWGPSADGGLTFDGTVQDWAAELDVAQIRGRRILRGRFLGAAAENLKPVNVEVLLDDRPADAVGFAELPRQVKLGTKLTVKLVAKPGGAAIREAKFFVGKPADGKPPPAAVAGKPTTADRSEWAAELVLPADKPGPVDLGAVVVTDAGVSTPVTGTVELVPFDPAAVAPGVVRGVLLEGPVPQAGVEVKLADEKGAEKGKTKTGPAGEFKFDAVPPGTYTLTAGKRVSGAEKTATATAKLPPKGDVAVRLDLYLKGK